MNARLNTNPFGGTSIIDSGRHNVMEALKQSGLDFNVEKVPLFLGTGEKVDGTSAIIRNDTGSVLGTVGSRYHPVQNGAAFDMFQQAFDDGTLEADICGSIDGGRIIWVQAKVVGGPLQVTGEDRVQPYVLLANSHDGSVALRAGFTAVRLMCMNRMAAAQKCGNLVTIRHTLRADLTMLREGIAAGQHGLEQVVATARVLSKRQVRGTEKLNEFTRKVLEIEEEDTETRIESQVAALFEGGFGAKYAPIRNSWWSAYNAVTEFLTHHRGRSGENRAKNIWFGAGAKVISRALDVAVEMSV